MTKKADDIPVTAVVVEDIKPLPPTQLISVVCSTCNHPFRARSSEAFQAAREDHLAAVHAPKPDFSALVAHYELSEGEPFELVRDEDE
jgi:hypothetical protein